MTYYSTRTVDIDICSDDALDYHDEKYCFERVARTETNNKDVFDINNSRERTFRLLPTNQDRLLLQNDNKKIKNEAEQRQYKKDYVRTDSPPNEFKLPVINTLTHDHAYNKTDHVLNKCTSRIHSHNQKDGDNHNKASTMLPSIAQCMTSNDTMNSFDTPNDNDATPIQVDEINTEKLHVSRNLTMDENSNAKTSMYTMQLGHQNQTNTVHDVNSERHAGPGLPSVQHGNSNNSKVSKTTRRRANHHKQNFSQPLTEQVNKGASTMPDNVERLLEASANDENIYKQKWRTGLEAYNDTEGIGKALQENQMARANALRKSPALQKKISRKKQVTDIDNGLMPTTSIAQGFRRLTAVNSNPITVDTSQTDRATFTARTFINDVQGITQRNTSRAPSAHKEPELDKRMGDVVISLLDKHNRPKSGCRSLERRNALFGLERIEFESTFKLPTGSGCPPYILEGYNRAAESIRFNVPSDFRWLETMTPLKYLSRHTVIDKILKDSYTRRFRMFQKNIQLSEGSYIQANLYSAVNNVFYERLGRHNYKLVEACVMPDEDLAALTLGEFVGICAFTERCFWRMFNSINSKSDRETGCRPYLEYLDFRVLNRDEEINMSVRMRTLLKSLA